MLRVGKEVSPDIFSVSLRKVEGEGERDRNRRLLGEFLWSDLGTFHFYYSR